MPFLFVEKAISSVKLVVSQRMFWRTKEQNASIPRWQSDTDFNFNSIADARYSFSFHIVVITLHFRFGMFRWHRWVVASSVKWLFCSIEDNEQTRFDSKYKWRTLAFNCLSYSLFSHSFLRNVIMGMRVDVSMAGVNIYGLWNTMHSRIVQLALHSR